MGVQELLDALNPYVSASYSNGVVSLKNAAGTATSLSINPVTSVTKSGSTVTVKTASGSSSTFSINEASVTNSTYYWIVAGKVCAQWGYLDATGKGAKTITLPHAMANTNYCAISQGYRAENSDSTQNDVHGVQEAKTTTSFKLVVVANYPVQWLVVGQAAT